MNGNSNYTNGGQDGGYRGQRPARPYVPQNRPQQNHRPQGIDRRSAMPRSYSTGGGNFDGLKLLFIVLVVAVIIAGVIFAVVKQRAAKPVSGSEGTDSFTDTLPDTAETAPPDDPSRV